MKKDFCLKSNKRGFSLIGAVVGIVVASIMIIAFTTLISKAMVFNSVNGQRLKATLYLQELIEITKDLEQSNWILLADTLQCYPEISGPTSFCSAEIVGNSWNLVFIKEENIEDIYDRWLTIKDVCRDPVSNEILSIFCDRTDSRYDEKTKKIMAEIEWNDRLGHNRLELEAYLYNYNP